MPAIRVGLIGLSGAPPDTYEGTSWTPSAHLPYLKISPDYEIVALLNSSMDSAKAAVARYELPSETKAYGNPEDLANDENVDLVVCSVRVDRHFQTVRPSIIAGKSIFVEWPLERNLVVAREMAALAAKHNARTIVGLQARFSPEIRKLKEIVDIGRIGKVLSSSWQSAFSNAGGVESKNVSYFLEREVGGNVVQIGVGHSLEFLNYVLGEFKSYNSLMYIAHPKVDIIDRATNTIITKGAPNNVPDQVMIQGVISPSDAIVNFQWRGGSAFPGTPQADWRIVGEKGELRLTSTSWSLNVGRPTTKIELLDSSTGTVETVVGDKDKWDVLPVPAHNIARLYEAFRKGEWVPDFDYAVRRHEFLEAMWQQFDLDT